MIDHAHLVVLEHNLAAVEIGARRCLSLCEFRLGRGNTEQCESLEELARYPANSYFGEPAQSVIVGSGSLAIAT
jgi:hypothetical protein